MNFSDTEFPFKAIVALLVFLVLYVSSGLFFKNASIFQRPFLIPVFGLMLFGVVLAWWWWAKSGVGLIVSRWISPGGDSSADPLTQAGQAGDLFGGFNALFAALAFLGAMAALWFQSRAMQAAQKQLAIQQEQMTLQAFEPMFVHLLESHRRVAESMAVLVAQPDYLGTTIPDLTLTLDNAAKSWHGEMDGLKDFYYEPFNVSKQNAIKRADNLFIGKIYSRNAAELGRYFRSLYHVFKFVKTSNLTGRQKIRYSNMARATLGSDHLALLALNCISGEGKGFVPLIEEYGLLKHLVGRAKEPSEARTGGVLVAMLVFKETAWLSAIKREEYWQKYEGDRPGDLVED
jgi:hypothetical protein